MRFLHDLPKYEKPRGKGKLIALVLIGFYIVATIMFLSACSTVTPNHVEDKVLSADTSTPEGYVVENNGWLGWYDAKHGIITLNKRDFYNALITDYRLQYRETYKVELKPDAGLEPIEINGTRCFLIDVEHIKALARLKQWQVDQKPVDSVWLKILNKVGV
jgi:hypothetical protein